MIISSKSLKERSTSEIAEEIFSEMSLKEVMILNESLGKVVTLMQKAVMPPKDPGVTGKSIRGKGYYEVGVHLALKETAQREVEKEIKGWKELGYLAHFIVDKHHKFVKVELINNRNNRVSYSAFSSCQSDDEFDEDIGKLIALYRANYGDAYKEELAKIGFSRLFEE